MGRAFQPPRFGVVSVASRLTRRKRARNVISFDDLLTRVHDAIRQVEAVEGRATVLERDLRRAFSRVGLVRYNPFEDTGGNQSFALALLDEHGDGFVMSSLHARNQTRVYAKGVRAGQPDSAMSGEEHEALKAALTPAPRLAETG